MFFVDKHIQQINVEKGKRIKILIFVDFVDVGENVMGFFVDFGFENVVDGYFYEFGEEDIFLMV